MPEEKKQAFIEAGKKFDINKGRAKQFTEQIIAATTPQEVQSGTEELIDDVEVQTGVDLDNTQPAAGKEIILTDEHKAIQKQLKAVLRALGDKAFYLKRSDGSYSEVVDVMFWPTSVVPFLKDEGKPQFDAPGLDKKIVLQQGVLQTASEKPLWNEVYKAKSHSWVFFIDPEKIQERLGSSNTYKVLNDVTLEQLIKAGILLPQKKFEKLKSSAEQSTQTSPEELVDIIASTIVDMNKEDQFVTTYDQNAPAAIDFVLNNMPTEQVDVLKTAPPEAQQKVVKAVAAELEKETEPLELKPLLDRFANWLNRAQGGNLNEDFRKLIGALDPKDKKIFGTDLGKNFKKEELKTLRGYFEDPKNGELFFKQYFSNEPKYLEKFKQLLSTDPEQEPDKEEKPSTTDPEKFDVDPELLSSLITASETFIDEFYEKAFLKDQGVLLTSVLTVLATIVEKEELEKAAKRTSKSTEKPEETEETETLAEQEEQTTQDPVKLRNIQVDLKSFIKLVKRSKDVLKAFDEFRAKGKIVGSSYKEKFMNILKQLQKNIKALVRDISSLNLISEKKDVSETENKWSAIEKGYNEASRSLSNIIAAGADDIESFDMEKNVNDAYTSLMSISGFFPSVNPFGAKTTKFNEYNELYTAAVKNVKSTIRDALELAKGKGGSNTANNTIESLKEFSGQILSIFGIPSEFEDVQVKPNEPAAEGEPETITAEPFENQGILNLPKPEKLTDEQKNALKDIEDSEEDTEIVNRIATVFVGVDSVPTEPEQIEKAAKEVKELKRDMEEMTEMSNDFGFDPEEMRAMVGLKRFLDKERMRLTENLKIPEALSNKIAEYAKQLKKANEGSHEVFVAALNKAAKLSEPKKEEFYRFLGIPIKKDVDRERDLRSKITDKAKKIDSKDPMKYFESYYDGDTALTPSADVEGPKKEKIIKLNQNFSKLFSLYSEKLFDDDKTSVTESVMYNVKRHLTKEEYRALDKAFDFLLEEITNREYQAMMGFIGQLGSRHLAPTTTRAPDISQKQHNALDIFIEVLKGISYKILGNPSGQFNDEITKTFRNNESLHEQLANKLKPLIKEMLTKGK